MTPALVPFPRLPEELVKLILECACEPSDATSNSAAPVDTSTTLSLVLVSRATYNLLIPRLYRSITISRPSQLLSFTFTLLSRPSLGIFMRNLWVGTLDVPQHILPAVTSSTEYAMAAKSHLYRDEMKQGERGGQLERNLVRHKECSDIVYLENGAEYAAMHVQSMQTQLTQPRQPPSFRENDHDYSETFEAVSSASLASFGGFGVDRESAGYDAAGDWIGMDEWMLRCIELQNMIEFHWEWVAATCPKEPETSVDEGAKTEDPMDWADALQAPSPLPSLTLRGRELSSETTATSSTAEYLRSASSTLGFRHLCRFSVLRLSGHSPRSAAKIVLDCHFRQSGTTSPRPLPDTLELLHDSWETDHFSHPALFARSGAIDLILGSEPPEGDNAPPDAIPASSAVFSSFGGSFHSSDEDTDSEGEEDVRAGGAQAENGQRITMEGRQRARERNALDFADLYGHVSYDSRTIYRAYSEAAQEEEDDPMAQLSQTLQPTSAIKGREQQSQKQLQAPLPTLGSLLATLRACLSCCPRLRVLGLNGFLERVVGGTRECVGLSELRHLSLGPPPPYWSSALHLHQKTLSSVRTMHISGCMLFKSEAMAIGGYTSALPNLREVEWTLWLGHVVEHPINVIDALSYMLGRGGSGTSSEGEKVQRRRPLRKVRATLNANDVAFWKQNARAETRDDARLVLQECASKEQDANIRAVRAWWERKAGVALT